ncbi:DHH family phosphoesterase [Candidatus Woesearchaeota archaeon]|nr:DHH family phosphoesterase [Candidatus Woesearchaeota archaeon]
MTLTEKDYEKLRDELDTAQNPLIFFHDDADGVASFLLFYRYMKEGHGIVVKTTPRIGTAFLPKVEEYSPDKVFVLDIAIVDQEFLDAVGRPVIWLDHHGPYDRDRVSYYNPRLRKPEDSLPASYYCYKAVRQDLWIAMVGTVGDWSLPDDITAEFTKAYPDLLPKDITRPEDALFASELGRLVKMVSMLLKGQAKDVMQSVRTLTRITEPEEILHQTTPAGKFLFKRAQAILKEYDDILARIPKATDDQFLIFTYPDDRMSLTKELSNELMYRNPGKVVVLGREKNGQIKLSLRSPAGINIRDALEKALVGIDGYGGGHEQACGANVTKEDFDRFISQLREAVGKQQDAPVV